MKTIYVDDEKLAVIRFSEIAKEVRGITSLQTFRDVDSAINFCESEMVDLAFLDIEMPKMNGLDLSKNLHETNPDMKIVFVTAHDKFALDAYRLDAVGYLTKPFLAEDLQNEIGKASRIKNIARHKVFIQTMPRFNVFVDGEALIFPGKKTKEMLALLVDKNGGEMDSDYAITYLWERRSANKDTRNSYRVLKKSLLDTLAKAGISNILISGNAKLAVNKTNFECDYYKMLAGDKEIAVKFDGRYMFDYSWAEFTNL